MLVSPLERSILKVWFLGKKQRALPVLERLKGLAVAQICPWLQVLEGNSKWDSPAANLLALANKLHSKPGTQCGVFTVVG